LIEEKKASRHRGIKASRKKKKGRKAEAKRKHPQITQITQIRIKRRKCMDKRKRKWMRLRRLFFMDSGIRSRLKAAAPLRRNDERVWE